MRLSKLYNVSLDVLINKPLEELINEDGKRDRYVFGLTALGKNGTIRLPQKAIEIFEITEKDALLVVGDKTQGIAIVKCGGTNDFIDENSGKEIR